MEMTEKCPVIQKGKNDCRQERKKKIFKLKTKFQIHKTEKLEVSIENNGFLLQLTSSSCSTHHLFFSSVYFSWGAWPWNYWLHETLQSMVAPPPQQHSPRGHRLTPALQQRVPRNLSQRSVTRLILRDGAGTGSGTVYPEEIKICILVWKLGPLGRSRFQTPTLPVNFLPDVFWTCPAGVRTLDGHKTRSKDWVLNPDTFA